MSDEQAPRDAARGRERMLAWVLMNMTDGREHHNSLGEPDLWRTLRKRGHVRRLVRRVSFYSITRAGRVAYQASDYAKALPPAGRPHV